MRCSSTILWLYNRCPIVPATTTTLPNMAEDRRAICWAHLDLAITWAVDLNTARVVKSVDYIHLVKVHIALVTRRHPTCPRTCLSPGLRRYLSLRTTPLTHLLNKTSIHPSSLARVRRPHHILMKVIRTLALAQDQVTGHLNRFADDI